MLINEIYLSINGEGLATAGRGALLGTGVPTVLVRTQGCPIRCAYCDSPFTWDGTETGRALSVDEILAEIGKVHQGARSVLLTGGEPGIQEDVTALCTAIKNAGYTLAVETAGGCDLRVFHSRPAPDSIILDVKGPSAGASAMQRSWVDGNLSLLRPVDQIKFVISDRGDWEFMIDFLDRAGLAQQPETSIEEPVIIVSPLFQADGRSSARRVVRWILDSGRPLVLSLQIHKCIWPAHRRRV